MTASIIGEQARKDRPDTSDHLPDDSLTPPEGVEDPPPPYMHREQQSRVNHVDDAVVEEATTSDAATSDTLVDHDSRTAGEGNDSRSRRGLFGKLKKLEDRIIGTEEERARQREEAELQEEQDRKRQELAYQKQVKRQQEFYAEQDARVRQGGTSAYKWDTSFVGSANGTASRRLRLLNYNART